MIKQTLLIILAITMMNSTNLRIKGTIKEAPGPSERIHSDFDETKIQELKQVLSQKNTNLFKAFKFEIVPSNDNFRLVLDLSYAKKNNNPTKSHVKKFYNFAIKSEFLNIECKFNFSVYTNLLEKNQDFNDQMKTCEELLSHVSVVNDEAIIELQNNDPIIIEKIQLDEPVMIIESFETVNYDMYGDETFSPITNEVREEITKVHPTLLKNLQISLKHGSRLVSHSDRIAQDANNTTGTDVHTKFKFELSNPDLNLYVQIETEFFGEELLSENESFKKQINQFVLDNEEALGEKIENVMTYPKIDAVLYNEPIIYITSEEISYPNNEAYTYNPVITMESRQSFKKKENTQNEVEVQSNLGENLLGAPKECTKEDRSLLVNHYENLLNSGRFNGMLYTENIQTCTIQRERGDLFRVVLRFNGQDCYLNLYSLDGNLQVQDAKAKRSSNFIIQGSDDGWEMRNCAETMGSASVRTELSEVRQ